MSAKATPAPTTGKRKRDVTDDAVLSQPSSVSIQIITGSYERVLHGLTASFSPPSSTTPSPPVTFSDTFLFHAHASAIRSLAISPPSDPTPSNPTTKRILATGSTDERINLYHINSTAPAPSTSSSNTRPQPKPLPFVANRAPSTLSSSTSGSATSTANKELGTLLHHASTPTTLLFPSRTKLLSAALDNTLAIARTRDWTVLSTLKAPMPKALNRPSGDTAAPGDVPSGINSVAVHPSAKLAVSVGVGERCMRLWDLVRGKRAGVLVFERGMLEAVGEGRLGGRGGEGRVVCFGRGGEEFAVGFERGAVVFGLDCVVRAVVRLGTSKVCQIRYLPASESAEGEGKEVGAAAGGVLAVSTEDGRVLFYDTNPANANPQAALTNGHTEKSKKDKTRPPPQCRLLAQIGTSARGSRVKDFEIFSLPMSPAQFVLVSGGSDGAIKLWSFHRSDLESAKSAGAKPEDPAGSAKQIGTLLATYESGRRITCLTGFVMDDPSEVGRRAHAKKGKRDAQDNEDDADDVDDAEPELKEDSDEYSEAEEDGPVPNGDGADDDFGGFED